MKNFLYISIFIALAVGGCATKTTVADMHEMIGPSHPDNYKSGFMAGCDSGYVAAGNLSYNYNKNTQAYSAEKDYKQGWDSGFATCKERKPDPTCREHNRKN